MIGVKIKKDKQQLVERKPQKQVVTSPAQADLQQALAYPQMATPDEVLALQQTAGNTAVTGWLGKDTPNGRLDEAFSSAVKQSRGSGMPLPPMLREEMEQSFKTSFDNIRLHTDEQADALSQKISARAFTIGSDIYFRQGTYSPNTPEGRRTLKHELTHIIQQGGRFDPQLKLGPAHDEHEQEAEYFSQGEISHPLANKPNTTAPAGSVQRTRFPWQKDDKEKIGVHLPGLHDEYGKKTGNAVPAEMRGSLVPHPPAIIPTSSAALESGPRRTGLDLAEMREIAERARLEEREREYRA